MAKLGRKRTREHPGGLTQAELREAMALLKPKHRAAPTDEAQAAATAKRRATMAAAQEQARSAAMEAAAARRAAIIAEAGAVRIGRDDLTERLRADLRAGRFR